MRERVGRGAAERERGGSGGGGSFLRGQRWEREGGGTG